MQSFDLIKVLSVATAPILQEKYAFRRAGNLVAKNSLPQVIGSLFTYLFGDYVSNSLIHDLVFNMEQGDASL